LAVSRALTAACRKTSEKLCIYSIYSIPYILVTGKSQTEASPLRKQKVAKHITIIHVPQEE